MFLRVIEKSYNGNILKYKKNIRAEHKSLLTDSYYCIMQYNRLKWDDLHVYTYDNPKPS